MSQHDFNIANQGFPATRADLNNALAALASSSSGTSEPSTTYAGQMWNDTTNNLLKFRNDANDGWITFAKLDQATNEWEVRSSVFQAVDSAGIAFKTDEGTTRATLGDDGNWVFTGGATFSGALASSNIPSVGALSNRNLIINGDFQVSQRGDYTTAFAASNNTYYLDRWVYSENGVAGTLQNLGRKIKLVATSSATGALRVLQKVELPTMNKFNGQTVTLSAKVKSNSAQARLGFYADGYLVPTGNIAHTGDGTEQTLTAQITVPALALSIEFDVFIGLEGANAGDGVSVSSGDYVEITGVQLEVGDTATPFEHRSYGDELARCQRYYETGSYYVQATAVGGSLGTTATFKHFKRATPTITYTNITGVIGGTASVGLDSVRSYGTVGAADQVQYDWIADAEL